MIFGRFGWLGDDPELVEGMMNNGDGVPGGGADGPASTEEVNLPISVDPAAQVKRQMEIQEAGVGTGAEDDTMVRQGLGAGLVRGETGGAADGPILAGQFADEQFLSRGIVGDFLVGQEGEEAFLESAETAFDLTLGLRAGGDQMGDAERGEGTLELGARIQAIARGHMAEQGQAIGVDRQGPTVDGKGRAKVLEVVPGGIGGDEDSPHQFAGVIVHRQEEGLLVLGGPPLVDGRIMLPEFAHLGALPSSPHLWGPGRGADEQWETSAGVSGNGLAVALEGKASRQFVGDELVIGRSLEGQESLEELLHVFRPIDTMVAPGEVKAESARVLKPGGAQAEEMGAAEIQKLRGGADVERALVESVQGLQKERQGDALEKLVFFKGALDAGGARRARLIVGLRYAPASSKPGPAGEGLPAQRGRRTLSLILFPQQSHFVPAPTGGRNVVSRCEQTRTDSVVSKPGHFAGRPALMWALSDPPPAQP